MLKPFFFLFHRLVKYEMFACIFIHCILIRLEGGEITLSRCIERLHALRVTKGDNQVCLHIPNNYMGVKY